MGMDNPKKPVRKPSFRQSKAIECWLKNGRKCKASALRLAGYGKGVIRHPDKVFNSPVVQALMRGAGIEERITFRPWRKENESVPPEMLEVQENVPRVDLSAITPEQVELLKLQLSQLPGTPPRVAPQDEAEIGNRDMTEVYKESGGVFEFGENWKPHYPNQDFSSM